MIKRDLDLAAQRSVYASYTELKGWQRPFEYDAEQAEYYRGEFGTDDLSGIRMLEIGFGSGSLLAWARDRGAELVGTEINEASLAAAAERGVTTFTGELADAAPRFEDQFDLIVAFDVFEHLTVSEIMASLAACERMLKPRGRLLLRFPNAQSPFGLIHQYADITHVTPLSGEVLKQLTVGTRLEVIADRAAYPVLGDTVSKRLVRRVRYCLQQLIERILRFVYATGTGFAPVVVVALAKRA